ncbi:hypothetical protein ACOSP7_004924 [Xanthoceras sorbifolium]
MNSDCMSSTNSGWPWKTSKQANKILVDQSTNPPVPFFKVDDAYDYESKPNETSVASNVYMRYGYGIL